VLFDLRSGKRRRVVQIVFGGLALLFAVGFVGFGIGGEQQGGILDALGLGGDDSGGDVESVYQRQIDAAERRLEQDPKDQAALLDAARYRFLAGQEELEVDEEGGTVALTEEAREEWNAALDSWETYVRTDPGNVDAQVANQMICAYVPLLPQCGVQAPTDAVNLGGAADTARLLAEDDPTATNFAQLASFLFFDGEINAGQEAVERALAEAKPDEREQLEKDLARLEEDARKYVQAQKAAAEAGTPGEEPALEDPFGSLGGTDTGLAPASP
jgi:hypothetical protein